MNSLFDSMFCTDALDLPSYRRDKRIFLNFRTAPVRQQIEEELRRRLSKKQVPESQERPQSEYTASVGIYCRNSVPAAWKEQTYAELAAKYPLQTEAVTWWMWQNRGQKLNFRRNTRFTNPIKSSLHNPPGEEPMGLCRPVSAIEMFRRDFPTPPTATLHRILPALDPVNKNKWWK